MKWRVMDKLYAVTGAFVNPVVARLDYCISDGPLRCAATLTRDECPLDDVVAGLADMRGNLESSLIEHRRQVREHGRAAADHYAIFLGIERRHVDVLEQFA